MGELPGKLADELTLYARQLGWLHAAPKAVQRRRQGKGRKGEQEDEPRRVPTRLEEMAAFGIDPPMPPTLAAFIVEYFMQVGPVEAGGMAAVPISWLSIDAWSRQTATDLPPWQAELLRRMSSSYLVEQRAAETIGRPPPWTSPEFKEAQQAVVAAKMDRM